MQRDDILPKWVYASLCILLCLMSVMAVIKLNYDQYRYDYTSVDKMGWFQEGYIRSLSDICNGMVKGYPYISREQIWTSDTYIVKLPFLGHYVEGFGFLDMTGWGCVEGGNS